MAQGQACPRDPGLGGRPGSRRGDHQPDHGANEVLGKVEDYFACGVQRVWVIYPLFSKVYDYASATSVRILTRAERLSGGDVLPGLRATIVRPVRRADGGRLSGPDGPLRDGAREGPPCGLDRGTARECQQLAEPNIGR